MKINIFTPAKTPQQNFGYNRPLPKFDISTPVGSYANEVFKLPRVHRKDEQTLLEALRNGTEEAQKKILEGLRDGTEEAQQKVLEGLRDGAKKAKQLFVNTVLRFVVSNVSNIVGLRHPLAMDLIQDGNVALLETLERTASNSDVSNKRILVSLNTRARDAVLNALPKDIKIDFIECEWRGLLGDQEDMPFAEIKASKRVLRRIRNTSMEKPLSLSMPVGRGRTLADVVSDDVTGNPLLAAENRERSECVIDSLDTLDAPKKDVLYLRFWQGLTLDEIGVPVGFTREGIRQVEGRALMRLKRAPHRQKLEKHIDIDEKLEIENDN